MAYWLLKTEPSEYSFDDLVKDKRTTWDGISNPVALKHLRASAAGDRVVVYHTGNERRAVGTAEIVRAAYDGPARGDAHPPVVDIEARARLTNPVDLATLKADPVFSESAIAKQGRLSFLPLTPAEWARLMALAKKKR